MQTEETLTVREVSNLITVREGSSSKEGKTLVKRVRAERHCGRCGETRHNSCTCKVEIEDVEDSEESK